MTDARTYDREAKARSEKVPRRWQHPRLVTCLVQMRGIVAWMLFAFQVNVVVT